MGPFKLGDVVWVKNLDDSPPWQVKGVVYREADNVDGWYKVQCPEQPRNGGYLRLGSELEAV